jgi:hypothetical protein
MIPPNSVLRKDAPGYLWTEHGVRRTAGTLRQDAHLRRGCRYFRISGKTYYLKSDLDEFARSLLQVREPLPKLPSKAQTKKTITKKATATADEPVLR